MIMIAQGLGSSSLMKAIFYLSSDYFLIMLM